MCLNTNLLWVWLKQITLPQSNQLWEKDKVGCLNLQIKKQILGSGVHPKVISSWHLYQVSANKLDMTLHTEAHEHKCRPTLLGQNHIMCNRRSRNPIGYWYIFFKKEGPDWRRIRKTGLKTNLKLSLTKGLKALNMIMGSQKGCCDTWNFTDMAWVLNSCLQSILQNQHLME